MQNSFAARFRPRSRFLVTPGLNGPGHVVRYRFRPKSYNPIWALLRYVTLLSAIPLLVARLSLASVLALFQPYGYFLELVRLAAKPLAFYWKFVVLWSVPRRFAWGPITAFEELRALLASINDIN